VPNAARRRSRFVLAAAIAALCGLALPAASRPATTGVDSRHDHDFEHFLRLYEAANSAFQNGDPSLWLRITAQKDPVSIFGGFGGLGETGTASVHQRYLLAATAFRPSGAKVDFQYLVKDVQGRLAYTVAIERSNVLYAGQSQRRPQILRVTMLFRRDHGGWKIVHRHADMMTELQLPTASVVHYDVRRRTLMLGTTPVGSA
jgi:ketosteroid isomerase-like protein